MVSTPLEQDQINPSRIQRVVMAAMRRPHPDSSERAATGNPQRPAGDPASALARATLKIEDGVLMAFGPEGDPIPPAAFAAAATRRPDAEIRCDGKLVRAAQVAAVLEAQARGPLGPAPAERDAGAAWIRAMLGLGPQPEMASDEELRAERRACELTAFGRELMITVPSGRSFLIAEAAPAHRAQATAALLADGQAVSVGDLVARLRAQVGYGQGGAGSADDRTRSELPLPDCAVQSAEDALLLQLPSIGVVRLADLGGAAAPGPRVSIFLTDGPVVGVADVIAELARASEPSRPAAGRVADAPPPAVEPQAVGARAAVAADHPTKSAPPTAAPVPLQVRLPSAAGLDPEKIALVAIGDLPAGGALSAGIDDGAGNWLLSPQDLVDLTLTLPLGHAQDVVLKVTAFAIENRDGELAAASDTLRVNVEPAAPEGPAAPLPLAIDPAVLQTGGPGLNAVLIRDLPHGARLSAGTYDAAIDGWVLLPRQLDGLTLTPPADRADFTLTVMGISFGTGAHAPRAQVLARLPIEAR